MKNVPREKFKNGQRVKVYVKNVNLIHEYEGFVKIKGNIVYLYGDGGNFLVSLVCSWEYCSHSTFDIEFLPRPIEDVQVGDLLKDAQGYYTFVYERQNDFLFCSIITRELSEIKPLAEYCDVRVYSIQGMKDAGYTIQEDTSPIEVSLEEIAEWKGVNVKDIRIKD